MTNRYFTESWRFTPEFTGFIRQLGILFDEFDLVCAGAPVHPEWWRRELEDARRLLDAVVSIWGDPEGHTRFYGILEALQPFAANPPQGDQPKENP